MLPSSDAERRAARIEEACQRIKNESVRLLLHYRHPLDLADVRHILQELVQDVTKPAATPPNDVASQPEKFIVRGRECYFFYAKDLKGWLVNDGNGMFLNDRLRWQSSLFCWPDRGDAEQFIRDGRLGLRIKFPSMGLPPPFDPTIPAKVPEEREETWRKFIGQPPPGESGCLLLS